MKRTPTTFQLINRIVAVLKPKAAFFQWLQSLPDPDLTLKEDDLKQGCTVLLTPEADCEDDARSYVESIYKDLWEIELTAWYREKAAWPAKRSLSLFKEWFEIEIHSIVIDVVDQEINKEAYNWEDEIL